MLVDSGGSGGSDIVVHPGRVRDVAAEYSGFADRAKTVSKSLTCSVQAVIGEISHPAVAEAVQGGTKTVGSHLDLVGIALSHCHQGLLDCVEHIVGADHGVASRAQGGFGA